MTASESISSPTPCRRPSRWASQIPSAAAPTKISPYQRTGMPSSVNATGSTSMTNGIGISYVDCAEPRDAHRHPTSHAMRAGAAAARAAGGAGAGTASRGRDGKWGGGERIPEPGHGRWCVLVDQLDVAAITAHPAGEPDLAGWLRGEIDRRRAGRREAAFQPRRGEDDTFRAGVVVLSPEDDPQRQAGPGEDRARPVTGVNGHLDDLVTGGFEPRPDCLLQHGYPGLPRANTSTTTSTTSAAAASGWATAATIANMPVIVIAPPAKSRSATSRMAATRSKVTSRSGMARVQRTDLNLR